MESMRGFLALLAGYLCGCISSARIVHRIAAPGRPLKHVQIEAIGTDMSVTVSGHSATTVSMQLGPRWGFVTVIGDMLKVGLPVFAVKRWFPEANLYLLTAIGGMAGHVWPVFYGFQGGHGLSSIWGAMLAIDPLGVLVTALGGMAAGLFVLRDFLAAYLGGVWLLIPWLWFRTHNMGHVLFAVAGNIVFVLSTIPELRRYMEARRRGFTGDLSEVMQLTGMGRGMYRLDKRMGILRPARAAATLRIRDEN